METQTLHYGTSVIEYSLDYADRKSLGIKVQPDNTVHVTAPLDASVTAIQEKLSKKASWILKQQDFFLSFHPLTPPRRYVSGETHLYLGKQYRLKLIESESESVKLVGGYLKVQVLSKQDKQRIEKQVRQWYQQKATIYFQKIYDKHLYIAETFYKGETELILRWMQKRWGSCSKDGKITLNTELIKAPKVCIEYVLIHELCHLKHHNHDTAFYNLLSNTFPNWQKVKYRLEKFMV